MLGGHESPVCEYREHDVLHVPRCFDHVPAEHRLAARQKYEADAEFFSLPEDPLPLIAAKLHHRLAVNSRVVGSRVAALTVQVAAGSYARDQIRRHMKAFLFVFLSSFVRDCAGGGKLHQKSALARILKSRLESVLDYLLDPFGQVFL